MPKGALAEHPSLSYSAPMKDSSFADKFLRLVCPVRTRNPIANFPKSNIKYNFRNGSVFGSMIGFRMLDWLQLMFCALPNLVRLDLAWLVYRDGLERQGQLRVQVNIQTAGYNVIYGFIYSGPWLCPG